jgi:hypothetical protein
MSVRIILDDDDLERADAVAAAWASRNLPDRFAIGSGGGLAALDARARRYVLSRRAEIAVAFYTGEPWNPDGNGADVGDRTEVRYRLERERDLPYNRRRDHAERRYVLAWWGGDERTFELVGWCEGSYAMENGRPVPAWREPGATCVSWRALRPAEEIAGVFR